MPKNKYPFKPPAYVDAQFARALRKVAQMTAHIVEAHVDGHKIIDNKGMEAALKAYSKLLKPWAEEHADKMIGQVSKANRRAFHKTAKHISTLIKLNSAENEIGIVSRDLIREQIDAIISIPIEAGERAKKLAKEAMYSERKASEAAEMLMRTEEVTESRALLIARTEVARSTSSINEARAKALGSRQYIWRNVGDDRVRDAHLLYKGKKLDGRVFSWDNPPTLDDGSTIHPGETWNCRCHAEPLFE